MGNLQGFDATQHKDMMTFDAIPDGVYTAVATDSEFKDTKNGKGQYLQITWEVVDGDHTGRMLWSRLNLNNPNSKAVEIAQQELATICRAVGVINPSDSSDLHNIPCMLDVGVRQYNGTDQNEIKGYHPANGASRQVAKAQEEVKKGNGKLPWQK